MAKPFTLELQTHDKSVLTSKEPFCVGLERERHGFPRKHSESACEETAPVSVHSEQLAPVPERLLRTVNCPMIWVGTKSRIFERIWLHILFL